MKKISTIIAVALLGSLSVNAEVIFNDTFDVGSSAWDSENLELPGGARQAAGTLESTYTATLNGGNTLIGAAAAGGGFASPMLIRVDPSSLGSVSLDLDTDFGPSVANQTWTLSYDGYQTRSVVFDGWAGFSVGSTAANAGGPGLTVELYGTSVYRVYVDGTQVGAVAMGPEIWDVTYNLTTTFDEVAGTAQITYSDGGTIGTVDFGTYNVNFADSSRFVELKNSMVTGGGAGVADWRVDNLMIETIPEPATLGLVSLLGGGLLWIRKRFMI